MTISDVFALLFLLAASVFGFLGKRGYRLGIIRKESTAVIFFFVSILLGLLGAGILISFPGKLI